MYTEKRIEDENLLVIVQKLVTTRQRIQIVKVATDWKVANVKTVEIGTLIMIVAVVTDHRVESLVVTLAVIKGIVEVKIGMEIEIDMTAVAIGETVGIMIIESRIGLAIARGDRVVLFEAERKENEMIDIRDLDRPPELAEIGISSSKSGTMSGIVRKIETETAKGNVTINIRILYQKVLK